MGQQLCTFIQSPRKGHYFESEKSERLHLYLHFLVLAICQTTVKGIFKKQDGQISLKFSWIIIWKSCTR